MGNKGSKREAADVLSISGLKQRHLNKLFERKKSHDTRSTRKSQSEISRTDTESTLRDQDSQSTIRGVSSPSVSTPIDDPASISTSVDGEKDDLPPSLGSTTQFPQTSNTSEDEEWLPQRANPLELAVTISDSSTPKPPLQPGFQQKNGFSTHSRSRSVPFSRSQVAITDILIPPLTKIHYSCYHNHNSMLVSHNTHAPVACMVCHMDDREPRWRCTWCCLRICWRCLDILERCKDRDLAQMIEVLEGRKISTK